MTDLWIRERAAGASRFSLPPPTRVRATDGSQAHPSSAWGRTRTALGKLGRHKTLLLDYLMHRRSWLREGFSQNFQTVPETPTTKHPHIQQTNNLTTTLST